MVVVCWLTAGGNISSVFAAAAGSGRGGGGGEGHAGGAPPLSKKAAL